MNIFSINLIVWAMELDGVSPLMRTVALCLADKGAWTSDDPASFEDGNEPAKVVDIASGAKWTGCSQQEFLAAVLDLRPYGVTLEQVASGNVIFRLPRLKAPDTPKIERGPAKERQISIYVISVPGSTKIGISVDPANRLYNLQCSNPLMQLTLEFQSSGPSSKIRAVERDAHAHFDDRAIGNEWFAITPAEAIAAIIELLGKSAP